MVEIPNSVRDIWKEGGTTFCISIPVGIVKKLNLDENSKLLVELVDDLIVLKKHEAQLSKAEIIRAKTVSVDEDKNTSDISKQIKEEVDTPNPLDVLDL